jgi:hypothetical protein
MTLRTTLLFTLWAYQPSLSYSLDFEIQICGNDGIERLNCRSGKVVKVGIAGSWPTKGARNEWGKPHDRVKALRGNAMVATPRVVLASNNFS